MSLGQKKIGFIGGGNMAEALITGLIQSRQTRPGRIAVSEPRAARRRDLKRRFAIQTLAENVALVRQADIIVLAIKPQVMNEILAEIKKELTVKQLLVSIAAGIDTRLLHRHLGTTARIIRAMPNTPALIGKGITGLYASKAAHRSDLKLVQALFSCVGEVIVFKKESDLDWVTALSGSGPAYALLFLESLIAGATQGGLTKKQAQQLALSTAEGAIGLARNGNSDLKTLRERVTSKGGTTEAALKVLFKKKWPESLQQAVRAAAKRARDLRGKQ